MRKIFNIFRFLILALIKIGDLVLWLGKLLIRSFVGMLLELKFFQALTGDLGKIRLRRGRIRRSRPKIIYPLPISFKLKYFLSGIGFSFLLLFLPLLIFIFLGELPNPSQLTGRPIPQTTRIYDRNNILLYEIYANQNRTLVPLSEIPKNLIDATIAIEDKDFYRHPGFDLVSILRALKKTVIDKQPQGGSTITQQLIKSTFLTPEPSIKRKFKEIILAFWAERIYSKDKILEMYLNSVPYGGTAWGVQAASETYFGKNVKDLTLAESALLAGLPAAPSIYSPFGSHPEYAKERQQEVLEKMAGLGLIKDDQKKPALKEELIFKNQNLPFRAPHFVLYVKDLLTQTYGLGMVEQGGLKVVTSLDLNLQEMAEKIVKEEIEKLAPLNVSNGATLITNPKTGEILAMVGSKDYFAPASGGGNFNVTTALRQPGSSIKAVTYAAALEEGFTPATILEDTPATFSSQGAPSYSPVNYDGRFHGRITLRTALASSLNLPAVKTLNKIGVKQMVEMGQRLGIKSWDNPERFGLSLTLGAGEVSMIDLSTVYGVLANQGLKVDLNPILKITDFKNESLEEKNSGGKPVLDNGIAFILSDILADDRARSLAFGVNSLLNIPGHRVSVKTGTSDSKRDNWTIGFTKDFLTAVWVGNNDNSPMNPALTSGITGAAPIWNKIMTSLLAGKEEEKPSPPTDVISYPCLGRTEYFIAGTEKKINCRVLPTPTPTATSTP